MKEHKNVHSKYLKKCIFWAQNLSKMMVFFKLIMDTKVNPKS